MDDFLDRNQSFDAQGVPIRRTDESSVIATLVLSCVTHRGLTEYVANGYRPAICDGHSHVQLAKQTNPDIQTFSAALASAAWQTSAEVSRDRLDPGAIPSLKPSYWDRPRRGLSIAQ